MADMITFKKNWNGITDFSCQHGMSLLELMIALALGVFIAAGSLNVYMASRQSAMVIEAQLTMQEAARFGFHFLAGAIRQAGYLTVGSLSGNSGAARDVISLMQMAQSREQGSSNPFTKSPWRPEPPFFSSAIVAGEDNYSPRNTSVVAMPGTDMLAVRLMGDAEPGRPEILDCEGVVVNPDSIAMILFFVGEDRQLYCKVNNRRAVPLVAGIENMQVRYGLTGDATQGPAGSGYHLLGYYSASEINDDEWYRVVSVQIGLLASSGMQVLGKQEKKVTLLDESELSFDDGRARQVFVQTVAIRGMVARHE